MGIKACPVGLFRASTMPSSRGAGALSPIHETGHMHGDHARMFLNKRVHKWSEELAGGMKTVRKMHTDYVRRTPRVVGMDPTEGKHFAQEFKRATEGMTALRASHVLDGILHPTLHVPSITPISDVDGKINRGIVIRHAMSNGTGTNKGIANFFIPFVMGGTKGTDRKEWDELCQDFQSDPEHPVSKDKLLTHLRFAYDAAWLSEPESIHLKILATGVRDVLHESDPSVLAVRYIPWVDSTEAHKKDVIIGDVAAGAAMARHTLEGLVTPGALLPRGDRAVRLGTNVNKRLDGTFTSSWSQYRHCLHVEFCGVKGGHSDGNGHHTYTHELVLFCGARHPSKHTLLSHAVGIARGPGGLPVHQDFVELFEGASDWREDAVCIPKCIEAMRRTNMLGEYTEHFESFEPLTESTSDWISDEIGGEGGASHSTNHQKQLLEALNVAHIYRQPEPDEGYYRSFEHAFNILSVNVHTGAADQGDPHLDTYVVLSMQIPPIPRMRTYHMQYFRPSVEGDPTSRRLHATDDLSRLYVLDPQVSNWYTNSRGCNTYILRNAAGVPYEARFDNDLLSDATKVVSITRATWLEKLESPVHWLRGLIGTVRNERDEESVTDKEERHSDAFFYGNKYTIREDHHAKGKGWYVDWSRGDEPSTGRARTRAAITLPGPSALLGASVGNRAAPTPVMQQQQPPRGPSGLLPPNPRRRQRMEGGGGGGGGAMLDTIAVELSDIKRFLGEIAIVKK